MRLRRILAATAVAATALALTACSNDAAIDTPATGAADAAKADLTLTTVDGEITLDGVPQRVVTFDYASLDTLNTLGLGDVVVGAPTAMLPESLQSFAEVTAVGTLTEPDFEAVAALDPDLILISNRLAEQLPQLTEIAPTANVAIDTKQWLTSSTERATDLAALFGKQDAATEFIDKINATADEIRSLEVDGSTMFVMTSGGKVSTYGPGSRYGFLYDDLGLTPTVTGGDTSSRHGQEVSFEFIAENNPGHMLVIDRDATIGESGQAAAALLDNALVGSTDAWKNDKVAYLNGANWYLVGGGLTTSQSMLTELLDSLK
ncbi:iron ABC transporter substrate-binding protein [Gulosibacter macacae]|uniref:Iron ABC transporter substrate-binding protein n=1 Tax=Gulosibacter macacae TaxID=2488791 RepID=A0A3P3VWT0_9MICO|nr:ABC transporter substrate-binding protein [Gulosibacter macacae]RRJ87262.1 iron ABC transporter substrate-binding protein [Gulosibacter macacae]